MDNFLSITAAFSFNENVRITYGGIWQKKRKLYEKTLTAFLSSFHGIETKE